MVFLRGNYGKAWGGLWSVMTAKQYNRARKGCSWGVVARFAISQTAAVTTQNRPEEWGVGASKLFWAVLANV